MTSIAARAPRQDTEGERCFREAALPHLDAVYTLARYMLRDPSDAEDAVQECYLRALQHFDTFRGPKIKPWLFAILRNVCYSEYGRQSRLSDDVNLAPDEWEAALRLWREPQDTPETETVRKSDVEIIRALVAALPDVFREAIVMRELDDLSYCEIAAIVGAPVGTVMSRLARGRAMLRQAWLTVQKSDEQAKESEQQFKPPRQDRRRTQVEAARPPRPLLACRT